MASLIADRMQYIIPLERLRGEAECFGNDDFNVHPSTTTGSPDSGEVVHVVLHDHFRASAYQPPAAAAPLYSKPADVDSASGAATLQRADLFVAWRQRNPPPAAAAFYTEPTASGSASAARNVALRYGCSGGNQNGAYSGWTSGYQPPSAAPLYAKPAAVSDDGGSSCNISGGQYAEWNSDYKPAAGQAPIQPLHARAAALPGARPRILGGGGAESKHYYSTFNDPVRKPSGNAATAAPRRASAQSRV